MITVLVLILCRLMSVTAGGSSPHRSTQSVVRSGQQQTGMSLWRPLATLFEQHAITAAQLYACTHTRTVLFTGWDVMHTIMGAPWDVLCLLGQSHSGSIIPAVAAVACTRQGCSSNGAGLRTMRLLPSHVEAASVLVCWCIVLLIHTLLIGAVVYRGPILLCVDTSGSMRGARETVAKALALECMRAAKEQERDCYVFAFAGPAEVCG